MTAPERICVVNCGLPADRCACFRSLETRPTVYDASPAITRIISLDAPPEAFAALPQVQALVAAAVLEARSKMDCGCKEDRSDCLCKSGNVSFCYREGLPEAADITPADATAALARMLQEAEDRGLERAAGRALALASPFLWE